MKAVEIRIEEAWVECGSDEKSYLILRAGDNVSEFKCPLDSVAAMLTTTKSPADVSEKLTKLGDSVLSLFLKPGTGGEFGWFLGLKKRKSALEGQVELVLKASRRRNKN